ncbi:tata box-binding protein-like protein [Anaeramoeba flamelloides]|uniref:Tata box-binding protein-like protein n=1 Tax=Anaeramoeba flamelloides TaxID=1746091 RepID=A0ABQ8YLY1_9EUKA|nr:tata box-binding protein-like protein [Anaeramoeba flamelloides]
MSNQQENDEQTQTNNTTTETTEITETTETTETTEITETLIENHPEIQFVLPIKPPNRPRISNMVATFDVKTRLNLKEISLRLRNAEYNPKRANPLIMRIREPKATALVHGCGKIVVSGQRDTDRARLASRKFAKILKKLDVKVRFTEFKIVNLFAHCSVHFPINLETLANSHRSFSAYEPDLFAGLIYRLLNPSMVFIIFVTGKLLMSGAKTREEIDKGFQKLYPVLLAFRKI